MLARTALLLLCSVATAIDMSWLFPETAPSQQPPSSQGGFDMSATFAKLRTCKSCIGAGYGWCPNRRKCGGFANKECGVGERYVAEGAAIEQPKKQRPIEKPKKQRRPSKPQAEMPRPQGTDMRALFATFKSCGACVGAGYGWCPMQRKCGGFANRDCGVGERYFTVDAWAGAAKAERNGLWKSRAEREREASQAREPADEDMEPAFEVPAASPSPPATVLHAGDVRPPLVAFAQQSNDTGEDGASGTDDLSALSRAALEARVLDLQSELKLLRDEL